MEHTRNSVGTPEKSHLTKGIGYSSSTVGTALDLHSKILNQVSTNQTHLPIILTTSQNKTQENAGGFLQRHILCPLTKGIIILL